MAMSIQRTVSEILASNKRAEEASEASFDDPFEEFFPYTVKLEKLFWEELVSKGVNPENYPDKTLEELLDKIQEEKE